MTRNEQLLVDGAPAVEVNLNRASLTADTTHLRKSRQGVFEDSSLPLPAGGHARSSFLPVELDMTAGKGHAPPGATVAVEDRPGAPPGNHSHWHATFHMITQMIGAGVLALPRSFAILGWVFGPILLGLFGAISFWSVWLLAEVYDKTTVRAKSYKDAVYNILGTTYYRVLVSIIYLKLFLNAVGYTVAGGSSIMYLAKIGCQWSGMTGQGFCYSIQQQWVPQFIFLSLQLVLNLLPNLESIWWVSMMGALASYTYSTIALVLSAWWIGQDGVSSTTSLFGNTSDQPIRYKAAFSVFSALGSVLFAWTCATLAPSIQSTLKEPPASSVPMKKSLNVVFGTTAGFYFSVAILGYAAAGKSVSGNILIDFDHINKGATVVSVVGNAAVLLHMISAVQLFSQPGYEFADELMDLHAPRLVDSRPKRLIFRLIFRSFYLGLATVCAASAPFFALFGGLIGSVAFFPIQVFFPYMMHARLFPPGAWKKRLMVLSCFVVACTCLLGIIGSLYGLSTSKLTA